MNIKLSFIRNAENSTGIGSNWIARVGHWVSRIPTNERNVWRRTPIRPPAIVIRRGQHRNAQCIVRRVLSLFLLFSSLSLSRCLFYLFGGGTSDAGGTTRRRLDVCWSPRAILAVYLRCDAAAHWHWRGLTRQRVRPTTTTINNA